MRKSTGQESHIARCGLIAVRKKERSQGSALLLSQIFPGLYLRPNTSLAFFTFFSRLDANRDNSRVPLKQYISPLLTM